MGKALRSLRVRFAVFSFLAIYTPVLVLFAVYRVSDTTTTVVQDTGAMVTEDVIVESEPLPAVGITMVLLAPFAAVLAWWLSGRAVRPVEAAIEIQGRLVEEASHELRTPLAVLGNNAEVILAHPNPDMELYREAIERSGLAASRMAETIDALLVDARGRARIIDRHAADLAEICAAVVTELTPKAAGDGVEIRLASNDSIAARVDPATIHRALTNLITNAVQHSPSQGVVLVDVSSGDAGDVTVSVTDDGPGIPREHQARIFERFWTDRTTGTGLGLAIARQIAEAHGGSLTVTSPTRSGRGAQFLFRVRK